MNHTQRPPPLWDRVRGQETGAGETGAGETGAGETGAGVSSGGG